MKKQSLLNTNIFLRNRNIRDRLLLQVVLSSSAVEGMGRSAKVALEAEQKRIDAINPHDSVEELLLTQP